MVFWTCVAFAAVLIGIVLMIWIDHIRNDFIALHAIVISFVLALTIFLTMICTHFEVKETVEKIELKREAIEQMEGPLNSQIADIVIANNELFDLQARYNYYKSFSLIPSYINDIAPIGVS